MQSTNGAALVAEAGDPSSEHPAADRRWPAREPSEDSWLRETAAVLWRRKALLLVTIGLVTLATSVAVHQITPRYTATTRILVGVPETNVIDVQDLVRGLRADRATLASEVMIVTSRALAAKVAAKLDLVNEPAFNPKLRPRRRSPALLGSLLQVLNPLRWIPEEWRAMLPGARAAAPPPPTPEEVERRTRAAVAARVKGAVSARVQGRSRVIAVTARSTDPKLAAAVVNTLSDLYLLEQLEAKFEATRRASDWLSERVQDLRGQVEASERAVEEYRQAHGLVQGRHATVTEQQISEINTQLILARAQTAGAGARLSQVQTLVQSESGFDSIAEVLASPLIARLREREADVARRAAEMATELGPRHPKMINIQAELSDLGTRLEAEIEKVVRGLRAEVEVAQTRERTLERDLNNLKSEAAQLNTALGQLRVLEREAATNRALFDSFLSRWEETGRQDEIQHPDARILSYAEVPRRPSSPRKNRIIAMAMAFSVFLGTVLVFLIEQLDNSFRSTEQIERMAGVGTLALVPWLTRRRTKGAMPVGYVLEKPASSFAESLRTLFTGVLLSGVDQEVKSILVTSSLPGEGKTTVAVALARLLAHGGRKVLLLDADLRRSGVARTLDLPNETGLIQLLGTQEEVAREDAIQHDPASSLHILTRGRGSVPSPSDLFETARMETLLSALRDAYDLIVIDSPPVHVAADTRVLARLADRTVFLVRWSKTRRNVALHGLKLMGEAGANLAGIALSMVNMRRHARYGYADSGYGTSRAYRHYYAE